MRKHPLSFWIYWIVVVTSITFIGNGAAVGRIASIQPMADPISYFPEDVDAIAAELSSPEPTVAAGTVLAEAVPEFRQFGIASWYGGRHQGRLTASGEVFDENLLTAAHRTLPLVTWARVTNLENGRSIAVRVNDRGPYIDGRVIDLSARAAAELGMTAQGLARVEIEALPEQTASSAME
jgi:rare lipoprotein A